MIYILFKRMDDFFSFWRQTLLKYRNYFQKQAFSTYNQYHIYRFTFLTDDVVNGFKEFKDEKDAKILYEGTVEVDDLDFQILKLLSVNARMSTVEIAEILNSNTKTVTIRIKRLRDLNVIHGYRIILDHFKLDYYLYKANIQLSDYNKRASIINYVLKNPKLYMIDESAGFVDLELNFLLKDTKYFHQIMEDLKIKFPNSIKDFNYFYIEKFHKFQHIPEE